MKRTLKKLRGLLLAMCMVLSMLPMTALAGNALPVSGSDWTLDGTGLLTITSDAGMTDWLTNVDGDFAYSNYVTSVVVGDTVTVISNGAFQNRTNITSVTLGSSVTTIGDAAFYNCLGITSALVIPASVTSIGDYAFYCCVYIPSLTLSNTAISIGEYAFSGCGITSLTIPTAMTTIGNYAFYGLNSLTDLTIPNTVTAIGEGAFRGCGITSVTIPPSVTTIGDYAFFACSLTSVTIPTSVTSIGSKAFSGCSGLINVFFPGNTPPSTIASDAFDTTYVTGIYVPAASLSAYQTALSGYAALIYAIPAAITKNSTTTYYPTLTDALAVAVDGDTITLLGDITESASNAKAMTGITVTIDGGGFTVTAPDSATESIALSLSGTGTVILKDLTLQGGASANSSAGLRIGGTLDVRSLETVAVMGGTANYSYGVLNYSTGTVDLTEASATGTNMGVGVSNGSSGTVNVSTAKGGGMQGIGVVNAGTGTINVTTASGTLSGVNNQSTGTVNVTTDSAILYALYNVSSGTVNVNTVTGSYGEAVNNSSGTVNAGTITAGTVTGTANTDVAAVILTAGTGASCVLDSITVAATGSTTVGALPSVYKDGEYSNVWYIDSAKNTEFSGTTVTSAITLYSYYYEAPKIAAITNNSTTTYYQTLTAALTAVADGDTVTLLSNTTESVSYMVSADKTITIDGGSYTLTATTPSTLTLSGTGLVKLKNLTLHGASSGTSTGLNVSGSVSVQSYGKVTANGGVAGVTNSGSGTVDVTEASASGGASGSGAYNTGLGTINVKTATGSGAMFGAGAYNKGSGTINVETATGSGAMIGVGAYNYVGGTINVKTASGNRNGVTNSSSGTINVTAATNTDAYDPLGSAVDNMDTGTVNAGTATGSTSVTNGSTGTVNAGTINGTTTNSGGGIVNTGANATTVIPLHAGTGASCVLDSITIAKDPSGTTQIGTLPDVYKDSTCSAEWYTDVALTNLFTMQEISPEATLYSGYYEEPMNTAAIAGVTEPVTGAVPTSAIADTTQYTAAITWSPTATTFAAGTVYTATITLTPKSGYTLSGVSANFFTVAGATATNAADSGTITAVFPATAASSSGGDGGGGGGSSTTTTPATTVSGSTATTTVTPTVSGGTATGSVTESQMSDALEKAKAAAGTSGTPDVEIQIDGASGTNSVGMTIPRSSMQALVFGGIGALTVSGPTGSVSFGADALRTISGAASDDVIITVAKTDNAQLSDTAKQAVGSHPVFELSVTSGGKPISQFGGSVTVSVPYTPAAGEDPNAILIYYIGANGELETVTNGHFDAATGTVIFTTTHFSTYAVGYNKVSFIDVSDTAWYGDAVTFLAARGITSGTTATTFSPDSTLTRGQFITMLLRAYGIEADMNPTDSFSDAGDTYYTGYLAAAKTLSITSGVGDNKFTPDQAITRQEMFTMLYNALKVLDKLPEGASGKTLSDFTDSGSVASWASEAMTALVGSGTVSGSGGKLSPTATTTRAEMAQVLYNLLAK